MFPAGHYWTPETGFVKYYNPEWDHDDYEPKEGVDRFKKVLEQAIEE